MPDKPPPSIPVCPYTTLPPLGNVGLTLGIGVTGVGVAEGKGAGVAAGTVAGGVEVTGSVDIPPPPR